ncbi:hypothetical protein ES332_A03G118900v1 [Gossypium tomentosum]|uniref:Uncharacterized protein n=1 Tax=Gossypium tomentosum TaxID=34277 RepID=A0A5D2R5F1_GOSTO|nr:hypothetical protein ES332_A03G118900v1 [Gossypium tomentosum]
MEWLFANLLSKHWIASPKLPWMLWIIIPNTRVKHVFREGNRSVDALANLESRSFCNQPHEAILSTVLAEAGDLLFGVVFCRILNLVLCYKGHSFFYQKISIIKNK